MVAGHAAKPAQTKNAEPELPDRKDDEAEKKHTAPVVTREAATESANPINTEVKWDDDTASAQSNFHNQPWENLFEWIVVSSKLSPHWPERGDIASDWTLRPKIPAASRSCASLIPAPASPACERISIPKNPRHGRRAK